MRLAFVLCCLLVVAPVARAAGLNLAWDQCLSEGGVAAKKFACNTSTGFQYLYGSFVPARPHPRFVGCAFYVDILSEATGLPDWWQFYWGGSCRQTALNVSFDFTGAPQGACNDPFSGQGYGGIANYVVTNHPRPDYQPRPNGARIIIGVVATSPVNVSAGTEYYGFRLAISNQSSAGPGACAGCATAACVTLTEAEVVDDKPDPPPGQQGQPTQFERLNMQSMGNMVSWQDAGPSCQSAVKNKTWGQLKSLYR